MFINFRLTKKQYFKIILVDLLQKVNVIDNKFSTFVKVISQWLSLSVFREILSTLYLKTLQNLVFAKVSLAKISPISIIT